MKCWRVRSRLWALAVADAEGGVEASGLSAVARLMRTRLKRSVSLPDHSLLDDEVPSARTSIPAKRTGVKIAALAPQGPASRCVSLSLVIVAMVPPWQPLACGVPAYGWKCRESDPQPFRRLACCEWPVRCSWNCGGGGAAYGAAPPKSRAPSASLRDGTPSHP